MRGEEVTRMAVCGGDQVIGWHRQSRDHWMSVLTGTQRHFGEELAEVSNPQACCKGNKHNLRSLELNKPEAAG